MSNSPNITVINSGQTVLVTVIQGAYAIPDPNSLYDKRGMYNLPSGNLDGTINFVTPFQYGSPSFAFPLGVIGAFITSPQITSVNATGFSYYLGASTPDNSYLLTWRFLQ